MYFLEIENAESCYCKQISQSLIRMQVKSRYSIIFYTIDKYLLKEQFTLIK